MRKVRTYLHPDVTVTEAVVNGLANHIETGGDAQLCPCNFYPDPAAWRPSCVAGSAPATRCRNTYCHCLLFVTGGADARHGVSARGSRRPSAYGVVKDPHTTRRATAKVLEKQARESHAS
jgi:ferredoxin-thioredoxin reductase catalytic subunit